MGPTIDAGTNRGGDAGQGSVGDGGGPTIVASQIQLTPTSLVSDGTTLFWTSGVGPGGPLSSMPVTGGAIATVVPGMVGGGLLAVDEVNVYYSAQGGVVSLPKSGTGTPTLLNPATDPNVNVVAETIFDAALYWAEAPPASLPTPFLFKSVPLRGGPSTLLATVTFPGIAEQVAIGLTQSSLFLSSNDIVQSFPIDGGVLDGGAQTLSGLAGCHTFASDTDAVDCDTGASIVRVANDGTTTVLGPSLSGGGALSGAGLVVDDTYVYWVDSLTVGTVMRAPKTGGAVVILARDTDPVALAVDAHAIYWSDAGGNIMRLAK